ncbi:MAG: hypothetical protein L6Q92_02120 [Phycisphaerae bacterium]|nr:hypothetical protein [Phycisphaerae bacterium]
MIARLLRIVFSCVAGAAMGVAWVDGAARADMISFDNSCGDATWHGCCDCGVDQKCNNWTIPASPAPICPAFPSGADDVTIVGDCSIVAGMTGVAGNLAQSMGTFTINGDLQVANLGTFDGPVVWNSGEIARSGGAAGQQVTMNGGLTIQGDDDKVLSFFGGFRLINAAAATWSGAGKWTIGMIPGGCCPAIFENAMGATFTVQNTASILQTAFGIGVIENKGTLIKSSAGLSEWAVDLNNTGTVHVQQGELRLTRAGIIDGTWMIDPGAEVAFAGNFFELAPTVVIQGRAVVKQSGTNIGVRINDDVTIDDLTIADDGRLGGTGILRIAGTLTNEGGDPSVHLHILPGGLVESSGLAPFFGRLDVEGTLHLPTGANMGCFGSPLNIMPGGVVTIDDGATLGQTGLLTQPIENHGTIRKPATPGTATIANAFNWFLNHHSDGVISVEGGTLANPNRLDSSGTFNIAANATFAQQSWGTYHPGTNFTGDGWFHLDSAPNNFIDAGFTLVIPRFRISGLVNAGDGISGPGNLTITKEFDVRGGSINVPMCTLQAGAVMNVNGPNFAGSAAVVFENFGRVNLVGQTLGFGVFNNRPGGVIDLQADLAFFQWFSNGPFNNEGTIVKSAGSGPGDVVAITTNTGTIRSESGRMGFWHTTNALTQNDGLTELAGGQIFVQSTMHLKGGVVRGAGDLIANVNNVGAEVEPGQSPGILTIASNANPAIAGNYTQGAGGRLEIEVGGLMPGMKHDRLVVTGAASLNGTLELKQFNGFVPNSGDSITILTAASVMGGFTTVELAGFPASISAMVQVNASSVVVTFQDAADMDGDGVEGPGGTDEDLDDSDPHVCRDVDGDGCDDCSQTGADGSGGDPMDDGPDADGDGICDAGDDDNPAPQPTPPCGTCGPGMTPLVTLTLAGWGVAIGRRARRRRRMT